MRIAVLGTGGVGGYFGGLLAHAGEDVSFIARGEHLTAIREHGLRVESIHGDFTVQPAHATDDPASIGPVDLVLFTTKTYQIDDAAPALRALVGPETAILPLQNGVDAADRVREILSGGVEGWRSRGEKEEARTSSSTPPRPLSLPKGLHPSTPPPVLGGACWVVSAVAAPGVIRQQSQFRRIVVGELDGGVSPRVEAIVAALGRAGATAETSEEIRKVLWAKFAFIASFSGLGAVARVPAGELMRCPETRRLLAEAIDEVVAVAAASGVALDENVAAETMAFCENLAPAATASMQRDIMAGRPSELEAHNGYLARRGAELRVPAPVHRFIYSVLLPQERRARQ